MTLIISYHNRYLNCSVGFIFTIHSATYQRTDLNTVRLIRTYEHRGTNGRHLEIFRNILLSTKIIPSLSKFGWDVLLRVEFSICGPAMAYWRELISHYLNQWWPRSLTLTWVLRPRFVISWNKANYGRCMEQLSLIMIFFHVNDTANKIPSILMYKISTKEIVAHSGKKCLKTTIWLHG